MKAFADHIENLAMQNLLDPSVAWSHQPQPHYYKQLVQNIQVVHFVRLNNGPVYFLALSVNRSSN